jgi:TRAP-type C4-dicarboxylate transport system permease small subunit
MEEEISVECLTFLRKIADLVSKWLTILGMWFIAAMGVLIFADVILRIFGRPLLGLFEIIELMLTICAFSAIAYTWMIRGHVRVTLFLDRFRPNIQAAMDIVACLCGIAFCGIIAWQNVVASIYIFKVKDVTAVTQIPIYPIYIFIVLGTSLLTIQMLITLTLSVAKLAKLTRSRNQV